MILARADSCSRAVVGVVVALLCLGCDDETGEVPTVPLQDFTQTFGEAMCDHAVACSFMPDRATCLEVTGTDAGVAQRVASANAGTLTYDNVAGAACIQAIRTASCDGFTLFPPALREKCDVVFGARKGEGEACFHAAECEGLGAACEGSCDDSCCRGVCRLAAGVANLGEPCTDTPCEPTSYCAADMTGALICTARGGPGASCSNDSACVDGYACDSSTSTCFKQASSGAQCNPDLASDGCLAIAEYCDATTRKCTPYPAAGKACGANALATNICAAYAYCDPATSTCVALPRAAEPCPLNACMGESLGAYGLSPTLRCSADDGSGTCETRAAVPACVQ